MFYPFMPGTYDRMAVTLSGMARILGVAGLLLVPIGIVWLIHELVNRPGRSDSVSLKTKSHWFAVCALAASMIVGVGVALASSQAGPSFAISVLILVVYVLWRLAAAVKRLKSDGYTGFNPTPLYLIVIPGTVATAQFMFFEPAVEMSRRRTMIGSTQFIKAIESYRDAYGRYPPSLESVITTMTRPRSASSVIAMNLMVSRTTSFSSTPLGRSARRSLSCITRVMST